MAFEPNETGNGEINNRDWVLVASGPGLVEIELISGYLYRAFSNEKPEAAIIGNKLETVKPYNCQLLDGQNFYCKGAGKFSLTATLPSVEL